ncbi:post-transcriptional regulator [Planococcus lenghuensis]|uniref:Competence protein ComN n=1 Tax=Planococcus lenghuensis TaxID=2213202 RepID=A0A1Q2L3S9_9BACL|nr:post-transcriptional regulator [Planococcus lenghuensis]AQQ55034.1 hypothetical protein B0X71_07285 [Planococcus lenghuensis]
MPQQPQHYTLLLPVLEAKCTEMRLLESGRLTPEQLWAYCVQNIWRKKNIDGLALHEKVRDILNVRLSGYMEFRQLEGFKRDNWFSETAADDWKELLKSPAKGEKRFDTH